MERTSDGYEVRVQAGDGVPFLRRVAETPGEARNQAEYLRLMLVRARAGHRSVSTHPSTVLVVKDIVEADHDDVQAYETILKLDGFRAATAVTIADARQRFAETTPDAVVLDDPSGQGVAMCRECRELSGDASLPIVLVTAVDPRHIALGTYDRPDAVLTKPCRPDTLTAVLKLLLHRPRAVISGVRTLRPREAPPGGPLITARCPLCATSGAILGPHGDALCQACGKEKILDGGQFANAPT